MGVNAAYAERGTRARPAPIWAMQDTRESNAAAGRAAVFMRSPADSQKTVQPTIRHPFRGGGESAGGRFASRPEPAAPAMSLFPSEPPREVADLDSLVGVGLVPRASPPRTKGLVRIGVDETSYRKGHKYMIVVVNHDTGTVVWCHDGHGKKALDEFFRSLDEEDRGRIKLVSADGARWVDSSMAQWVPQATHCVDTFHVVQWATDELEEIRRQAWRAAHAEAKQASGRKTSRGADVLGLDPPPAPPLAAHGAPPRRPSQ